MAGKLYIETFKQDDITPAVEGISHVFMGIRPVMIPLEEMPDLLRTKKSKQLEPGMYVRIKRGLYAGDLALVDEVEPNGTDVTLRIVPRLDYGVNEDQHAPVEFDANGKRKRPAKVISSWKTRRLSALSRKKRGELSRGKKNYIESSYLLAFLSIIRETDAADFHIGRTRSCARLHEKIQYYQ